MNINYGTCQAEVKGIQTFDDFDGVDEVMSTEFEITFGDKTHYAVVVEGNKEWMGMLNVFKEDVMGASNWIEVANVKGSMMREVVMKLYAAYLKA